MTRPIILVPILSLSAWGVIGALAWYAPGVLLAIGGGAILAVAYDICLDW
jgi:hypothetical protein